MINKDYILRLAESFGRQLAIILRLRKSNQFEDALIFIDDLFFNYLGLTTGFINSASEEMILKMISPMGQLDSQKCLFIAILLREEGAIYEAMGRENDSFYRYLKSLSLFIEALFSGKIALEHEVDIQAEIENLLQKLADYELPATAQSRLFRYYYKIGHYAKAGAALLDAVASQDQPAPVRQQLIAQAEGFYIQLLQKSDADLRAGNFTRSQAAEDQQQLRELQP